MKTLAWYGDCYCSRQKFASSESKYDGLDVEAIHIF